MQDREKGLEALQEWREELIKTGCMPYCMGPMWPRKTLERLGPQYELVKKIKGLFDPHNIMNPGHLF
jgi:FAD/FMN-containing dehydrogenase